jgi:hypothetical protein
MFTDLPESSIPIIGSTFPSPLQYGYRTKITPHFDAPPVKVQKGGILPTNSEKPDWLRIGFNQIGRRYAMDIEVSVPKYVPHTSTAHRMNECHRNAPSPRLSSTKHWNRYGKTSFSSFLLRLVSSNCSIVFAEISTPIKKAYR